MHFNEVLQIRNSFIVPTKEIRVDDGRYKPFDQFAGCKISGVNL